MKKTKKKKLFGGPKKKRVLKLLFTSLDDAVSRLLPLSAGLSHSSTSVTPPRGSPLSATRVLEHHYCCPSPKVTSSVDHCSAHRPTKPISGWALGRSIRPYRKRPITATPEACPLKLVKFWPWSYKANRDFLRRVLKNVNFAYKHLYRVSNIWVCLQCLFTQLKLRILFCYRFVDQ